MSCGAMPVAKKERPQSWILFMQEFCCLTMEPLAWRWSRLIWAANSVPQRWIRSAAESKLLPEYNKFTFWHLTPTPGQSLKTVTRTGNFPLGRMKRWIRSEEPLKRRPSTWLPAELERGRDKY